MIRVFSPFRSSTFECTTSFNNHIQFLLNTHAAHSFSLGYATTYCKKERGTAEMTSSFVTIISLTLLKIIIDLATVHAKCSASHTFSATPPPSLHITQKSCQSQRTHHLEENACKRGIFPYHYTFFVLCAQTQGNKVNSIRDPYIFFYTSGTKHIIMH